jgi:hypothetical protein
MNQRDKMRELFARHGDRSEILIREYSAAEKRGEVIRNRDANKLTSEEYAEALLRDARKRGWISELK